jgi:hypothetical protein
MKTLRRGVPRVLESARSPADYAGRHRRSSRELRRNASTRSYQVDYKASTAQWHAERRAGRPKTAKLVTNDRGCASTSRTNSPESFAARMARS